MRHCPTNTLPSQTLVRNPPQGPRDHSELLDTGRRLQQMKMVVTNTTAGMIIGKRGETVRSLNEQYDVRIQASQKDDLVMGERIISILGGEDGESGVGFLKLSLFQRNVVHFKNKSCGY